jgi:putative ABC transport system permease protein
MKGGGRMRAGLITVTGTGAGTSAVLALLVIACVFVCVATPRASLGFRTKALRQLVAATPAAGRAVTGTTGLPTLGGALGPQGQPVYSDIDAAQFGPVGTELTAHLRGDRLPVGPGQQWWGVSTGYLEAPGAAKSAYNGSTPPVVELLARSGLGRYGKLVAGRMPATGSVGPASARFQVAVTTATAAKFSLRVGSAVRLTDSETGAVAAITLIVTGIVRPVSQSSAFWTADPDALMPSMNGSPRQPGYWLGAMFIADSELDDLENAVSIQQMQVTWMIPLGLSGLTANQASTVNSELNSALLTAGVVTKSVVTPLSIPLVAGVSGTLTEFVQAESEIGSLLALLYVSLTIVGLVVLLLGARLLAERRAAEFSLIRARGATRWQVAVFAAWAGVVVVIPAAAAGVLLGVAVTPGQDEPLAWWLAALTCVAALVCVPWLAMRRVWGTGLINDRADSAPPRTARVRRLVADAAVIAAAIGGLVVLRLQGPPPPGGTNWYTSAAPVLAAIPMAIVVVRVYPVVLRWLVALTGRRKGVISFVGLARAARASLTAVLPAFALVLALAVIAFGAMLRDAVVAGDVAQSWRAVGADAVIDASGSNAPLSRAAQRVIGAVPGVRRATAVTVTAGAAAGGTIGVIVVNPASYASVVAQTPAGQFPAAPLEQPSEPAAGGATLPALASPGAAAAIARKPVLVGNSLLRIRLVGLIRSTPGVPVTSPSIVVPSWAFNAAIAAGRPPPNLMIIVGPVNEAKLRSAVSRQLPGATTITFRSAVLAALTGATLARGAYATFAQVAAAAAGFGVIVMLIMLALEARPRELTLARLFTMGLTQRQARRLVITEALPAILAAAAGGAICAWALVPLLGPSIDLAPFTGTTAAVPMRADFAVIGYLTGCLVVLAVATLFAQAAAARLRGVSRALRVGE